MSIKKDGKSIAGNYTVANIKNFKAELENVEKTVELEIDKTNIIESEIYENIGENI